ncbi:MAG: biopolymer transporter ExbD [Halobacteria archaeon]|nr:biopolymer transporter ExbD [Halobacteria archaeon]
MKMSRRALRMEKHHKRKRSALGINLVSLMDIFTILVFFLLVNSSDGEVLPTHKSVVLPESVSEEQPRVTVVIMINPDNVLLHGKVIAPVEAVMNTRGPTYAPLKTALSSELTVALQKKRSDEPVKVEATIMGDKTIPFSLLKKVMATCVEAGYHRVSLAVMQKPLEEV